MQQGARAGLRRRASRRREPSQGTCIVPTEGQAGGGKVGKMPRTTNPPRFSPTRTCTCSVSGRRQAPAVSVVPTVLHVPNPVPLGTQVSLLSSQVPRGTYLPLTAFKPISTIKEQR
jgi:hypothetical protein